MERHFGFVDINKLACLQDQIIGSQNYTSGLPPSGIAMAFL